MSDLSMKPSKEDLVHRKQSVKKSKSQSNNEKRGGRGLLIVVFVLLFASVAAGAGGGWYLWQQLQLVSSKLESSNSALTDSESALGSLKSELKEQNNTLSKQKGKVAKDIVMLKSEVRKLWDVSNKRNKKNIKSNKDDIAAITSTAKKQKVKVAGQSKAISALSTGVSQLREDLAKRGDGSAKLLIEIKTLKETIASIQRENTMLKTSVVDQENALQILKSGKFQRQIADLEQAINAIDAHRRQVNSRLDQLDKELGALYLKK